MQAFLTPWNIGGGVAGLVLSVAALIGLVSHRRQVGLALKKAIASLFSQAGFFTLVILVFMLISVLESGQFFNANITHGAIFGLLGYALALGFDLVSVVCMLARLNAQRMRDDHGSRLNLVGVIICAAVSAFANCAGSLQEYSPSDLSHTPLWMRVVSPWLSMVFPALIVVLSMTTDHILDHAPARGIDVGTYREREHKRVDMVQVRLDTERALLALETELATLRRDREQASGHVAREWVWWTWLRPPVPAQGQTSVPLDQVRQELDQAVQAARVALEGQLARLHTRLDEAVPLATANAEQLSTLQTQVDTWTRNVATTLSELQTSLDHLNTRHSKRAPLQEEAQATAEHKEHGNLKDAVQRATAQRILAALTRVPDASDRQVARDIGCSRPTVARWRRRFQQQGLLEQPPHASEQPLPLIETTT